MLSKKKIQTKLAILYDEITPITDRTKRFVKEEEIGILEFIIGTGPKMTGKRLKQPRNNADINHLIEELKKDEADLMGTDPFRDNGEGYKAMLRLCEWVKGE